MLYDYSSSYPDRYTPESKWVRVLPVHGRPIQTAELIEMQSILHENLKRGFDTLYKNGTVIEGIEISITSNSPNDTNISVAISAGTFYVDGTIVNVPESALTIPNTGSHSIGIKITESIITEKEDASLRDPIKGVFVAGTPGAARLVWLSQIVLNDIGSFTIAKVIDGSVVKVSASSTTYFERLLSKYVYERNGNFCVSGLDVSEVSSSNVTVADTNRYGILLNAVNTNTTEAQNTLNQALEIQARLNSLQEQLITAQSNYDESPTTQNQLILSDINSSITEAEAEYNSVARLLVVKQDKLNKSRTELESNESLLINKLSLLLSPGIAYIQGRRIEIATPVKINIPKQLGTGTVDSAVIRYTGNYSSTLRSFTGIIATAIAASEVIEFRFQGLKYQEQTSVDIKAIVSLAGSGLTSVSAYIDFLVREFNSVLTPSSNIIFSSASLSLPTQTLRQILKTNVVASKSNDSSILFTSAYISEAANNIILTVTTGANLTVDIATAALGGASRTNSLQLGFRPVNEIISLVVEAEEKYIPIIRGAAAGTSDYLGDDSIIEIASVVQGSTVYVVNRDFRLINQSQIDWSLNITGSIEPAPGSVYYVSFVYTQPLTEGEDFVLNREGDIIEFTGTKSPGVNRNVYIDYSYYLARSGVITIDYEGQVNYILGESSTVPLIPSVPDNVLAVSRFDIYANQTIISKIKCNTVSFSAIRGLIDEVKANSKLINTLSLQNEVYELGVNNVGSDLVGITYDTLQDISNADINNADFTAAIVPAIGGITCGYNYKDVAAKLDSTSPVVNGVIHNNQLGQQDIITLNYTERPFISQDRSTKLVNVQDTDNNGRGHIYLSTPLLFRNQTSSVSKYSPCDLISSTTALISRLCPTSADIGLISSIKRRINSLYKSPSIELTKSIRQGIARLFNEPDPDNILNDLSYRIRTPNVEISMMVEGLSPNTNAYEIYISGKRIENITVYNGTQQSLSSLYGVNSKSDGRIWVRFTLPEGLECGVHILEVIGESGYARTRISIFNNLLNQILITANYNWDSNPTELVIDNIPYLEYLDIDNNPVIEPVSSISSPGVLPNVQYSRTSHSQRFPYLFDRVNQTFEIPNYLFLTSVEVKYGTIPSNEAHLYLREVDSFGPQRMTVAKTNNVLLEANTTTPDEWSKFTFLNPVPLSPRTYSFGLDANSDYSVYTAVLGERDILTSNFIGDQPYLRGDLYLSGDGNSISLKKDEDLTYRINAAYFSTSECTINLGNYGSDDGLTSTTAFCFNSQIIAVEGTQIIFEYKEDGETQWIPFMPNVVVCLSEKINRFAIRARMSTTNRFRSPIFSYRNASVSLYSNKVSTSFISEAITYEDAYKDVDLYFKYVKAPSSSISVYYTNTTKYTEGDYSVVWTSMTVVSEELVEEGLQVYRVRYSATNTSLSDSRGLPRKAFRYKITIANNSTVSAQSPLLFDVVSYVS